MAVFTSTRLVQFFVEYHYFMSNGSSRRLANCYTYHTTHAPDYVVGSKNAWTSTFVIHLLPSIAALLPRTPTPVGVFTWAVNITGDTFALIQNGPSSPVPDDRLPLSKAIYFNLGCGLRARQFVGSKRIGPIRLADVVGDELTAAAQVRYTAAKNQIIRDLFNTGLSGTDTLIPVVWSRAASFPAVPPAGQQVSFLASVSYDKSVSSWRHRREPTDR